MTLKINKLLSIPLFLIILTSTQMSYAAISKSAFLCDNTTNIHIGSDVQTVTQACGKPFSIYKRSNKVYIKYKTLEDTIETELKFKFINNRLVSLSYEKEDVAEDD